MNLYEIDETAKKAYYSMDLVTALRCYAEAFVQYPKMALAYGNYGNILREAGYPIEAYGFLETAMKLDPEDRNTPFNYAVAHLAAGDLEKGWELFESRWRFKFHEHTLEDWDKPRWNGEDISGKKLLITCEEGDGDNIQFIRFITQLSEMNITPIIQTEPHLKVLFKNSFAKHVVIDNTEILPEFDYWTPILSLTKCLRITYDNLPKVNTYLKPTKDSIKMWGKVLGSKQKPRIGFCWSGRSKSYPLECLIELIKLNSQFEWINLQMGAIEKKLLEDHGIVNHTELFKTWNDTAGLLHHLDVIISIDTGLCHLAGALGKPCILLLDKYKTCWRWLYERNDTPWYPSIEMIRQIEQGNYDEQLFRVHESLAKKIDPEGSIT